jgi:hypothetical protein
MKTSENNKFTLSITILILLIITTWSCKKDFLERKPLGEELSEDFFTTESGAVRATNAVYNQLREFNTHTFPYIGIANISSDDADKGSDPGDAPPQGELDNFTVTAGNGLLNGFWVGHYQGIARANQVIERVPAIPMNDTLKNRLISEARFLRAYFYFNLVRTFGRVPLITRVPSSTGSDPVVPQSPSEEVYKFIVDELNAVIGILPEKSKYPPTDLGRVTNGAAKGLLAKVYMYQKNWGEVLRLTDEIIASGEYDLSTPFVQIFTKQGELGRESVFEVVNAVLPQCGGGSQYAEVQMVRGPINALGWGFNTPSQDLINSYEPNDPRMEAAIMFRGETMSDGYIVPQDASNPQYNQKAYPEGTEKNPTCGIGDSGKNIRILRYADILLMNAEAANELSQPGKAVIDINLIRARARQGAPAGTLADVSFTDQISFRNLIWQERRVELAMENDRFWDLVRQGRAGTVLRALGKNFVDGKNEVMPIPQQQIDISGGALTQNPMY